MVGQPDIPGQSGLLLEGGGAGETFILATTGFLMYRDILTYRGTFLLALLKRRTRGGNRE